MRKRTFAVTVIALAVGAIFARAEMPEELKGTWILDAEATKENVKNSPGWSEQDTAYLPAIIKRMSQVIFEFTDDELIQTRRTRQQAIPLELKESNPGEFVFVSTVQERELTTTVSFVQEDVINIRSSASDDMDYFLWQRGELLGEEGVDDASPALEVVRETVQQDVKKEKPVEE